jgi:hypothetical protein
MGRRGSGSSSLLKGRPHRKRTTAHVPQETPGATAPTVDTLRSVKIPDAGAASRPPVYRDKGGVPLGVTMRPWVPWLGLAVALFAGLAPRLRAGESDTPPLTVVVTEAKGIYSISARLWIPAPPATVWTVLTDYDHVAAFTHDIQMSRLVERQGDVCIVEQRGRGVLGIPLRVWLRVVERPLAEIQFEALDGDFRVYRGAFRLEARDEGTEVTYTLESQGKFWIPPSIGRPLIRGRVRRILQDIGAEVLRRQAGPPGR